MSGIGHLGIGLAAKSAAPKVPLLALLAASEVNDLAYFLFTSIGLEQKVDTTMDFVHGVTYLTPTSNPWSHGLFMSVVYSVAISAIAYLWLRDRRSAGVVGAVVFSHWILDFLMHSNLPLFFTGSLQVGLGLENSGAGLMMMTVLDLILVAAGIVIYLKTRKHQITGSQVK